MFELKKKIKTKLYIDTKKLTTVFYLFSMVEKHQIKLSEATFLI